jgi:CheY-like chemotaxis protein
MAIPLRKPMLLCVDDSKTCLYLRKQVLEGAGYSVLVASDSLAAMEIFTSTTVDLVVSDYLLKDGTGIELAIAMKRLKPKIPIAILSGMPKAPEGIERADGYISKGEPPPQLLLKISKLLKGGT